MRCVGDACGITIGDIISGVGGWCVCVCRESWYVDGCNYFQLGVHYECVLETSSFGFSNLGAIVCLFNVMLLQLVVYLAVYVSSVLCR